MTGNRGILHVSDGVMGPAIWAHRAWLCCRLDWKGRRREVMSGRKWTELFFLDEAVAMAAGHRPCGHCRRPAFLRWRASWEAAFGPWPGVAAVDAALHAARAAPGARRLRSSLGMADHLPVGAMVRLAGDWLLTENGARAYDPGGYGPEVARPTGSVEVLTNAVAIAVLRAGYCAELHSTAKD
jgi:hypothetical protein